MCHVAPGREIIFCPNNSKRFLHFAPSLGYRAASGWNDGKLIRSIFFNRLGAANLLSWFARVAIARLRSFVNFLEDVGDHRGRGGAAVNLAADVAFIDCSERVLRFLGR